MSDLLACGDIPHSATKTATKPATKYQSVLTSGGQNVITRRNGIYYYRKGIPEELRPTLGKREFFLSLHTRDSREALLRASKVDVVCCALINQGRESMNKFSNTFEQITRTENKKDGTVTVEEKRIDPAVIDAMRKAGVSQDQISLLIREFLMQDGQDVPDGPAVREGLERKKNKITVGDYVVTFITGWEASKNKKMDSRRKTQLRRLGEILSDTPVTQLSIEHAAKVRDTLLLMPKNNSKYQGLSVSECIEQAQKDDPDYIKFTATTVERHFEGYIQLYNSAPAYKIPVDKNLNPFKEIEIVPANNKARRAEKKRRKEASKRPYTFDELELIFGSSLYRDYGSEKLHEGVKFWIPLIALFTGSRMSQIASLYCNDITKQDGIPVIDFNDDTPDKTGKTDVSLRNVPMHPVLVKLGLPEYAKKVRAWDIRSEHGGHRLFPELRSFSAGSYAGRFEEWHNRKYLTGLGIRVKHDNRSFHAYRATLLQLLKLSGADEYTRNSIIGWSANEENANKVVRMHYETETLTRLHDALSAIQLPQALKNMPPFPLDVQLDFGRRYTNQWT